MLLGDIARWEDYGPHIRFSNMSRFLSSHGSFGLVFQEVIMERFEADLKSMVCQTTLVFLHDFAAD